MSKHRVRLHTWEEGRLTIQDEWFDDFSSAMDFAKTSPSHRVKIYNPDGHIVHSASSTTLATNTYA
jgi:methylaspartate ammonia-lyase